jgi:alkylhydroperoxidase family enzyme
MTRSQPDRVRPSASEDAAAIIDRNGDPTGSPLDSHPQLRTYIETFLRTFILEGRVDPRLRELVILRIAWRCGQPYEWAQHYRRARSGQVTDEDILSMRADDLELVADESLRLLARAADEVVDLGRISAETYRSCAKYFDDAAVLHEFLHLVAGYRMMATVLSTTSPSVVAAGLPLWPPDGNGPRG